MNQHENPFFFQSFRHNYVTESFRLSAINIIYQQISIYLFVHLKLSFQERVQNPVKNLRWNFMRKLREIFSKIKIFSCNIYIRQIFETARWESR